MAGEGRIRCGIGGWTFEPWRGVFYPEKLTQAKELSYAASKLTSIEINGTYYGSQKPESFRKWAAEVPDGFVFSVKGPRFATNRRVLAEAGLGVAFRAKTKVAAAAQVRIDHGDLTALLYLQGYSLGDFVTG